MWVDERDSHFSGPTCSDVASIAAVLKAVANLGHVGHSKRGSHCSGPMVNDIVSVATVLAIAVAINLGQVGHSTGEISTRSAHQEWVCYNENDYHVSD